MVLGLSRDEAIDSLILLVLTVIAITGFRYTYGGHDYLIVGAAGALLGMVLSHLGNRAQLPLLAITALGVAGFVLLGGLVPQDTASGAFWTLSAMRAVISASVHGWKQLLTTARPVGATAHLLVLPYLLGLVSGLAGHALARRTSRPLLPAAVPAAVAAMSILFGTVHAAAAVLQGAVFAALVLVWVALRQQRGAARESVVGRERPWQRLAGAGAMLAVAVAGGALIGPYLPGARAHARVVLRAVPPFDVNDYPSPLAGFRAFTKDAPPGVSVYGKRLFTTTGLPPGSRVRIAAMDTYDGLVWGVANAAGGTSSFAGFQRIGATVPEAVSPGSAEASARTATITIDPAYQLPWLPVLAGATRWSFAGPAGRAAGNQLWFNVATGTGIVPSGVPAGLRYRVTATAAAAPTAVQLARASPDGAPSDLVVIPAAVAAFADAHSGSAATPVRKVLALAAYLRKTGAYSDGGVREPNVLPGHSEGRLTQFLRSAPVIGDDEQYAAAMALLANAVGVPARVSLDGTVESDGSVYGRDVRADVEVDLAQYGWVTLPASQFTGTRTVRPKPVTTPAPVPAKVVPPPVANTDPGTADSANQSGTVSHRTPAPGGFQLPAFVVALLRDVGAPLLLAGVLMAALIGSKAARRRRRRRGGPPSARVAGGWRELLDLLRDLGVGTDPDATRREQAAAAQHADVAGARAIAVAADAALFGPDGADEAAARRIWREIDKVRAEAVASLGSLRRLWVMANPASLWPDRAARTRPRSGTSGPLFTPIRRPHPADLTAGGDRS